MLDYISVNFTIDSLGAVVILLLIISQVLYPHREQEEFTSFHSLCLCTLAMCVVDIPIQLLSKTPDDAQIFIILSMRAAKVVAGILCALCIYKYAQNIKRIKAKKESAFLYLLIYAVIMIIAVSLQNTVTQLEVVNVIGIILLALMYFFMEYNMAYYYDGIREEMTQHRIKIMMSQIQPHFLYNVLTNISELTQIDAKEASEAIEKFSTFLRGNMGALNTQKTVPFSQELAHTKDYLYLEQLRFGDFLNVEYDIETMDFEIPPLTLQPLVENAVKYGVGDKEEGGTVKISVHEDDDRICVLIEDDGVGFDVDTPKKDGRTHVGFDSTRKRVERMSYGTVEATSILGEGTLVTVSIPKKRHRGQV